MIERHYNADFINSVINDPSVSEGAEVKGIADVSAIVVDLNNYVLVNEYGGFVVIRKLPGIYECHTQFLPSGRGLSAVMAAKEAFRYMFLHTDCERVVTKANAANAVVQRFTSQFFRKRGCAGGYFYYSADIDDWIATDNACLEAGQQFHQGIEEDVNHDDDSMHDRFVGAAILLARHGNLYKGQAVYNRWAVMAGYEPLLVLSERPIIVQAGDMRLCVDERIRVCR